jgi:hypothetical protein
MTGLRAAGLLLLACGAQAGPLLANGSALAAGECLDSPGLAMQACFTPTGGIEIVKRGSEGEKDSLIFKGGVPKANKKVTYSSRMEDGAFSIYQVRKTRVL